MKNDQFSCHRTSGIRHRKRGFFFLAVVCGLVSVVCGLVLSGCRPAQARGRAVDAQGRKIVEISMFEGGFGSDFQKRIATEYEKLHPEVVVRVNASPRNNEVLRPRFIAGNPPDVVSAGLPLWILIEEGQVYPLDDALNTPAYGQPHKLWRDTFRPGLLDLYRAEKDGKIYGLPADYNTVGFWYNVKMFREHGWEVPKTWDELLAICEKAQAKGIDPIAFQGRYAGYIMLVFWDLLFRVGGPEAVSDLQNLKPGAWETDAVIRALTLTQDLRKEKYIPDSYMGMSHMEAQMEFVQGRAAMVPCGTWLANEMRQSTPEGFLMDFFPCPMPEGGKGDPTALVVGPGAWFIPAKANYPEIAADYLKFMMSLEHTKQWVQQKWALFSIQGADEDLPPVLQGAAEALENANYTWMNRLSDWYFSWGQFEGQAALDLVSLKKTPRQITAFLQQEADFLRKDPRTEKHHMPVPAPRQTDEGAG